MILSCGKASLIKIITNLAKIVHHKHCTNVNLVNITKQKQYQYPVTDN